MEKNNTQPQSTANRTRKMKISFAVSDEEYNQFQKAMEGQNIKSWRIFFLMKCIPGYVHKEKKAEKNILNQFVYQLSKIANNLNQIESVAKNHLIIGFDQADFELILNIKERKSKLIYAIEKNEKAYEIMNNALSPLRSLGIELNNIATRINSEFEPFINNEDRYFIRRYHAFLEKALEKIQELNI